MDRTFSRIENLWPRDGSCPLPLRSKPFPGNCFRIVKVQKISSGSLLCNGNHRLLRTKFLPLFVQRRWPESGITLGRLMKFSRYGASRKRKIPPTQRSDGFCRVNQRQNESGVLRAVNSFVDFSSRKWWVSRWCAPVCSP